MLCILYKVNTNMEDNQNNIKAVEDLTENQKNEHYKRLDDRMKQCLTRYGYNDLMIEVEYDSVFYSNKRGSVAVRFEIKTQGSKSRNDLQNILNELEEMYELRTNTDGSISLICVISVERFKNQ